MHARLAHTNASRREPWRSSAQCSKPASGLHCPPSHPPPVAKTSESSEAWRECPYSTRTNCHRRSTDAPGKQLSQNPGGSFLCRPHLLPNTNACQNACSSLPPHAPGKLNVKGDEPWIRKPALRQHRHRPGVVVFKETAEGGLGIFGVQGKDMRSRPQRGVGDADALKPDDRVHRRGIDRNRRVEPEYRVVVRYVAAVDHRGPINRERNIQRLQHAVRHEWVGRRAVCVAGAQQHPQRQHERLVIVQCDVQVSRRAIARRGWRGKKHGAIADHRIAIRVSRNSDITEGPAKPRFFPSGKAVAERGGMARRGFGAGVRARREAKRGSGDGHCGEAEREPGDFGSLSFHYLFFLVCFWFVQLRTEIGSALLAGTEGYNDSE